jgi:hypothetical protein
LDFIFYIFKIKCNNNSLIVGFLWLPIYFFVDKSYVNTDFVGAHDVDVPFQASNADMQIMQDTTHYRVLIFKDFLNAKTSYFHKSIGGFILPLDQRCKNYLIIKLPKTILKF